MKKETFIEEVVFGQNLEEDGKEYQKGEVKTRLYVVLVGDLTDSKMCTLGESTQGRGKGRMSSVLDV